MSTESACRIPKDLHVDFGAPAPGSSNPMPDDVRRAYRERIEASSAALSAGARLAHELFVGAAGETP